MKNPESDKVKYDESINDLTQMVLEGIEEEFKMKSEPFDLYANRLRASIHSNEKEFRSRCARGYLILLDEIIKEKRLHS